MKTIINKISVFALCLSLGLSFNHPVYANDDSILDSITGVDSQQTSPTDSTKDKKTDLTFSDISGHWAEKKILQAVKIGFVGGYEDGTFKPDKTITRAEFATLLNKAIGNNIKSQINFVDVNEDDWFYDQVQKAIAVNFFSGYDNNTFKPNNPISRQEAAKVITGTISTGDIDGDGATMLTDYSTIQDWAKSSVNLASNKGYIKGYPEGLYKPTKPLTRAEAVKIIYEILDNENFEYGFNITNPEELYYGAVVVGNLNIIDSVGSSNVYINNVTVLGDIKIFAKNLNSVILTDVKSKDIIVENSDSSVKITCNDNIYADNIYLSGNASVDKTGNNINIKNTVSK